MSALEQLAANNTAKHSKEDRIRIAFAAADGKIHIMRYREIRPGLSPRVVAHCRLVETPIRKSAQHHLLSQHLLYGASDAVATGYAFLPFVMVAGLSVFPLTAVEGLAYAIPVLAVEIGIAALHLDDLGWGTHLGSLWLLFLIAVVATLSSMSQLGLMMALVRLAIRDCLTGCFTRNTGEELLEIQCKIAQRNQSPLALVFADLDDFKAINDIHGHKAGDRALVHAACRASCAPAIF